jgi:hypothetical protein
MRNILAIVAVLIWAAFSGVSVLASPISPPPDSTLPDAPQAGSNSGPQDVAVIILDFPGTPDTQLNPDPQFLHEAFYGTKGGVSVSDFFAKASENRVAFRNFKIFGPFHLTQPVYCEQEDALWKMGVQAAQGDVNFQKFSRIVFVLPKLLPSPSCDIWGALAIARAELQCIDTDTPEGSRCLNFAWIGWQAQMKGLTADDLDWLKKMKQEGYTDAQIAQSRDEHLVLSKYFITKLFTHEMLHGWGLMHTNTYTEALKDVVPPVGQSAPRAEYGDSLSVMSSVGEGNPVSWLVGAQLARLGWLNDDEWTDVEKDGTFDVSPLSFTQSGLKVLKIPRKTSSDAERNTQGTRGDTLWVEYREILSDYDSISFWAPNTYQRKRMGIVLHQTSDKLEDGETVLLNFNPGQSDSANSSVFQMPNVWRDVYSGVQLELLSQDSSKARIRVSFH